MIWFNLIFADCRYNPTLSDIQDVAFFADQVGFVFLWSSFLIPGNP